MMLTGRPPFQGDSVAVTLQKVLTEEPECPRKLNGMIPRGPGNDLLEVPRKGSHQRYPTAQALADDLLRYAERTDRRRPDQCARTLGQVDQT